MVRTLRRLGSHLLDAALGLLGLGLLWQLTYWAAGPDALSAPLETLRFTGTLVMTPSFARHLDSTLSGLGQAFALVLLIAIPLGIILGKARYAGDVFEPVFASIYTIPKVTLYPVVLAVFGLGMTAKVAYGVMHGVIPMVLIIMGAVRAIPPVHFKTARVLRLSTLQTARHIIVPMVFPEIVTAFRVGFSMTFLGVLVGEMFAARHGLGYLLMNGILTFNIKTTLSVTLLIVFFSFAVGAVLLALDAHLRQKRLLNQ